MDAALSGLQEVAVPAEVSGELHRIPPVPEEAPDFVQRITAMMIAGKGDLLPVSALPVDGTFPTDTAKWEKRSIAREIPVWDPEICIDCAKCALVCPHAAIRMKVYEPGAVASAPETFKHKEWRDRDNPGMWMTIQVAPDDCTGCGVCVDVCPAKSKEVVKHKSIDMMPKDEILEDERDNFDFFLDIPLVDRRTVKPASIKGLQMLEPLFQFSGACGGCGETPYLKALSQMFGDRILIANATGCSSIYGGNLPTTPWSQDANGRGPAWANSLFEDNAEFGLGMRLSLDHQVAFARTLLEKLAPSVGQDLARAILDAPQGDETLLAEQRERIAVLKGLLETRDDNESRNLLGVADALARKSVWIVGGDGWAYDIGFGGLDHVLASGRDVNVLVLDTAGLLEHRRTGLQGDPARRRGEVRGGRQGRRSQGPRDDRGRVRQRVRRADRAWRGQRADGQGARGGRVLERAVADHRLLDLHRARHRHGDVDDPPEGGGGVRVLAALPLRPAQGRRGGSRRSSSTVTRRRSPSGSSRPRRRGSRCSPAHGRPSTRSSRPSRRPTPRSDARFYEQLAGVERHAPGRVEGTGPRAWQRPQERAARRDEGGTEVTADLRTTYLGLSLANPLVPSASTLSSRIDNLKRLQDAGASAVVMQSLFEEQIEHEELQIHRMLETGSDSNPESLTHFPELEDYNTGPDEYLRHLEACKKELAIPVIGSLNGSSEGGWIRYAKLIQEAGADALELNVYFVAADPDENGWQVERRYLDLVRAVRDSVSIPLAVKVGPYFSSMGNMARQLVEAGADGLVLFNRFLQPDIDLETLEVDPTLHLSTSDELRLPLRWIAILHGRLDCSLAATSGVHTAQDVVKLLLAGADVTMMASTLFQRGPEHLATLLTGLRDWLDEFGYLSVEQLKGSVSQANVADPSAFARSNYMQMLVNYSSPYDWREIPGSVQA